MREVNKNASRMLHRKVNYARRRYYRFAALLNNTYYTWLLVLGRAHYYRILRNSVLRPA